MEFKQRSKTIRVPAPLVPLVEGIIQRWRFEADEAVASVTRSVTEDFQNAA